MRFTMIVDMDDDALANDPQGELARIVTGVAALLYDGAKQGKLRDVNGNSVGTFKVGEPALPADDRDAFSNHFMR